MGNMLDRMNCDYTALTNLREHANRNTFASVAAACLFFIGWWVILDVAAANYVESNDFSNGYYAIGVMGSIAFFMINSVSNSQLRDEGGFTDGGCCGPRALKLWLFMGIMLGFSCLIASGWILFANYFTQGVKTFAPGIGLFIQNLFIFIAAYVYKFGRSEELY